MRIWVGMMIGLMAAMNASAQDTWDSTKAPLLRWRYNHASASASGRLFVFGGTRAGAIGSPGQAHSMDAYDPTTNAWTSRAGINFYPGIDSSEIRYVGWSNPGGAAINGDIYQFGGNATFSFVYSGTFSMSDNSSFKYNVAANTWSAVASMPMYMYPPCAVAVSSKIYVCGPGYNPTGTSMLEYVPSTNTWATKADLTAGSFESAAIGCIAGKIYLAGGISAETYDVATGTYEYNPSTDQWATKASMPEGRAYGAFAAAKGRLYVFSGTYDTTGTILEYTPALDTWDSTRASMPAGRVANSAAVMVSPATGSSVIHVTGGQNAVTYAATTSHYVYAPPYLSRPEDPTGLFMRLPGGTVLAPDCWTGSSTLEIGASTSDAGGFPVQVEVEIIHASQSFTGIPNAVGASAPAGTSHVTVTGLTEGPWKWQLRVRNSNEETNLAGWMNGQNVNIDLTAPSTPQGVYPANVDVMVRLRFGGLVQFAWQPATDNSPNPITYVIEVATDTDFMNVAGTATVTDDTTCTIPLNASNFPYWWRIKAIDDGGLTNGFWSTALKFEVHFNDGINHSEGDAGKVCGFSAPGTGSPLALLALLVLMMRIRRS